MKPFSVLLILIVTGMSDSSSRHPVTGQQNVEKGSDLVLAARVGDEISLRRLITEGIGVDATREDGSTALMLAVLRRHNHIVSVLLDAGANVNARNSEGWTALLYAITNKDTSMVSTLLERGAEVNVRNEYGDTPLTLSVSKACKDITEVLLEKGADIDARDEDGNSPLSFAALNGNRAMIDLLLQAGADTLLRNNKGQTALMLAEQQAKVCQGYIDLVMRHAANARYNNNGDEILKLFGELHIRQEIIDVLKNK